MSIAAELIRQRKLKRYSILRAHNLRNVAFARRVFDKVDVPRPHGYLFPSRNFDLSMAAQRDHVLPARRTMPIVHAPARCPMELGAHDRHHFGDLRGIAGSELQFDLFGMRLIVRTRVEVSDHQRLVSLSENYIRFAEVRTDRRNAEVSHDCSGRERAQKYQDSTHHFVSLRRASIAVVGGEAPPTNHRDGRERPGSGISNSCGGDLSRERPSDGSVAAFVVDEEFGKLLFQRRDLGEIADLNVRMVRIL